jgi:hypothetical protein
MLAVLRRFIPIKEMLAIMRSGVPESSFDVRFRLEAA